VEGEENKIEHRRDSEKRVGGRKKELREKKV